MLSVHRDLQINYSKSSLSTLSPFGRISSLNTDFLFPLFECFLFFSKDLLSSRCVFEMHFTEASWMYSIHCALGS